MKRLPTLSYYDRSDDATPQARQAREAIHGGSKIDLPVIGTWECWCGRPRGHDWPGASEGAPHPREPR